MADHQTGNESSGARAKEGLFQRLHSTKLILWWSIAWAIGSFALAPLVNYVTPFLDSSYVNQWTPDIYWRLVLYWHGAIFIPWITMLAVLASTRFHLDQMSGIAGRLVRESVFVGGFFAVPIAAVAGILDVYDTFLFGIPLWTQIFAFLIGDEMAVALILAMAVYPRVSGTGYRAAGMPYYTVFTGVFGALVAAMMGHIGGWITWFGPSPAVFNQYINSTMYPVLGYSNSTSVVTFTEDVVGSHSHLMLVALMAGVVALVAVYFGYYEKWGRNSKRIASFGFAWMTVSLLGALWIYIISGVGNYQIPSFFVNGVNGVAGDDLTTGMVGLGAVFVLVGFVAYAKGGLTAEGRPLIRDPLFLTIVVSWITIYLVIPVTGFYINFNESFYRGAGINLDLVFTRFHQDFGFFVLPALVTVVLALESFNLSFNVRRYMGYFMVTGVLLAFAFGESYALYGAGLSPPPNVGQISTLFQPGTVLLEVAALGGVLIGLGALYAALCIRRSPESRQD
jgi:hypothetical protein